MFERPPREREWLSWLYVVLWTVVIFLTIPFVRDFSNYVHRNWGRESFTYGVTVVIVLAAVGTVVFLLRRPQTRLINYACLLAVAGLLVYLTFGLGSGSPEEAVHYVQYGVLGVLIYRAFTHRIRDYSIYAAAAIVGTIVGMLDETVQWMTPRRYFGLNDIWLNFTAVALIQIGLATGIRPEMIRGWPGAASLRRLCHLGALAMAYLGLCFLNTPDRIDWYTERVPLLGFIKENRSVMVEFGYRHVDPDVGMFNSRLTTEELIQTAEARAEDGAAILDQFRDRERYSEFLGIYTTTRDPFLHEARVHLFRRDIYVERGDAAEDEAKRRGLYTVAYWENRILEKYFGPLLAASSYVWPPELQAKIDENALTESHYLSGVSVELITGVTQAQVVGFFIALVAVLLALGQYFGRRAGRQAATQAEQ